MAKKKAITGASHVPEIAEGVYQVGTAIAKGLGYDTSGAAKWKKLGEAIGNSVIQQMNAPGMMQQVMKKTDPSKMSGMCGDCIGTTVTGGHDPKVDKRRTCQLCGTLWRGIEPDNNRRQAILDQRKKRGQ